MPRSYPKHSPQMRGAIVKRYELRFSVVASFSGQHPELSDYCHDVTLQDVIRDWPDGKLEPSEPFESEYAYCARQGSIPSRILDRLEEASGETKFQICRKLKEFYPRESFWACIADAQGSGIFDRKTFLKWIDDIGASFETDATLGTLGGPLAPWGGIVPDMAFNIESQTLISSIRVTPILCKDGEPVRAPSEWEWERIKTYFKKL